MNLEVHSSKSPPLLTFVFYNTSCVSLISFFNIFSNILLPLSSGYVHPRPITAVNHKGKPCWRGFCHIFAFVSQPDPRSGRWEIQGISNIFLITMTTEESICRHMFLTGFWEYVYMVDVSPPTCLHLEMVNQAWLVLMQWPYHFTLGMRLSTALCFHVR